MERGSLLSGSIADAETKREQDETPRSKDRSATSDGMLSVDREDERETARYEQIHMYM